MLVLHAVRGRFDFNGRLLQGLAEEETKLAYQIRRAGSRSRRNDHAQPARVLLPQSMSSALRSSSRIPLRAASYGPHRGPPSVYGAESIHLFALTIPTFTMYSLPNPRRSLRLLPPLDEIPLEPAFPDHQLFSVPVVSSLGLFEDTPNMANDQLPTPSSVGASMGALPTCPPPPASLQAFKSAFDTRCEPTPTSPLTMYSSSSPNRSQPYPWTGSPGRVSGPSTHNPSQTSSTHAQWPNSATYPNTISTAGNLNPGSYPPTTLYTETYPYDASNPHANAYQASDQASTAPYTYGSQVDTSTSFSGGSGYQGYNPPTTGPSTSLRGGRATVETNVGYGGSSESNVIHLSPYQPPSTPQETESSKPSHKRKSRKDTTKAPRKASQPAPAPAAPPSDDSDQEHAKKKSRTDEEKRRRKALQAQFYRAQHAEAVRHLEDALPEAYKTYDDPPGRETVVRGVRCIKETRNELDAQNMLLRRTQKERDALRYECDSTEEALRRAGQQMVLQQGEIRDLRARVGYWESTSRA
ncbi:hypothetical protein EVG20_g2786 [Dentipellis fragilis]|uniref:Uncharacterized protein n=1 Tax=Dentipellis fragilis TaxID=205917 RepID=A0A4Y9Z646_9AGAM|nr:hypothetical protein EVG20_g2786 [Dentipellis fragilis]